MAEKKKTGRPEKLLTTTAEQVEELAGFGLTLSEMCSYMKISQRAFFRRRKLIPELDKAINRGRAKASTAVIRSLYKRATEEHDTTAMIFWLKNMQPDRWQDRRQFDQKVQVDGKLQITVVDTEGKPVKEDGQVKK